MLKLILDCTIVALVTLAFAAVASAQAATKTPPKAVVACPGGVCKAPVRFVHMPSLPILEATHARVASVAYRQPVRRSLAGMILNRRLFRCR